MTTAIGIGLILAGLAVRIAAIRTLRRNWSLSVQRPQQIVTVGLYRCVRHPSYVGTLLMVAGMAALSTAFAVLYVAFMFLLARAIEEEKLMASPEYEQYRAITGMFLPRLRTIRRY